MKNLSKAVALMAAIVVPVAAHAQAVDGVDAFVSVAAGYNNLNAERTIYRDTNGNSSVSPINFSADGLALDVRGTVAVPVTRLIGAQVDVDFDHTVFKANKNDCNNCAAAKLDNTSVTAHLFARDPKIGLIGLIGQRTATTTNVNVLGSYSLGGQTAYFVGGEGQYYVGPVTAYAQVTYGTVDSVYSNVQGINAQGQLRYYPLSNLMFATKGAYERFTGSYQPSYCSDCGTQPLKTWMVGAKVEYKLANLPVSLTADYEYRGIKATQAYNSASYSYSYNSTYHDSRVMVGAKLNLGHTRSLLARDRSGASLDAVNLLALQARSLLSGNDAV